MTFQGWPEEALDFYEGLEADNSKTYWLAHKEIYETCVLQPMTDLLAELAPEHGDTKIFRPYRDVRFSRDKAPYKTQIGAVIGDGYIQLSGAGLGVGSGMYQMAADQLDRYRKAVTDDLGGSQLEQVIATAGEHDISVHGHDVLKTAPRGYSPDHPRIELLRYKGLVAWQEWEVQPWLGTPAVKQRVADFLVATRPLNAWLADRVGPSTLPER